MSGALATVITVDMELVAAIASSPGIDECPLSLMSFGEPMLSSLIYMSESWTVEFCPSVLISIHQV
jgi:hypothetical protein